MDTLLNPDTGLVIWTVVTFLCLVFLLKKFAWGPLVGAIEEREAKLRADREGAEAARRQAEGIRAELEQRIADLRGRFTDYQIPDPASHALLPFFHYVDRCSAPTDRILVGGFLVEVPFYARRLFAGGQSYFGAYFGSEANERAALRRLRDEVVPFAVLPSDYDEEFERRFPLIASYLRARYVPLTDVRVDDELTVHLLVDGELPSVGRDAESGWPCYAGRSGTSSAR